MRVALDSEVSGKRKRGQPKNTCKKQVEEETEKIGLKKAHAFKLSKVERWRAKNFGRTGVNSAMSAKRKYRIKN